MLGRGESVKFSTYACMHGRGRCIRLLGGFILERGSRVEGLHALGRQVF